MPEQERRSHGFEVILEEARTQRRPKSAPQPQSRKMASVEERLKAAEERRKEKEAATLAQLAAQEKRAEEVRAKKRTSGSGGEEAE